MGESERLRGIDWQGGHLASVSFSAGGMRYERNVPVTESPVWPRGDFAFDADGRRLAAPLRRDPATVGIWDVALGRLEATVRGSSSLVTAVAFSPDGERLATAADLKSSRTEVVTIWDLASRRAIQTFDVGQRHVECRRVCP